MHNERERMRVVAVAGMWAVNIVASLWLNLLQASEWLQQTSASRIFVLPLSQRLSSMRGAGLETRRGVSTVINGDVPRTVIFAPLHALQWRVGGPPCVA